PLEQPPQQPLQARGAPPGRDPGPPRPEHSPLAFIPRGPRNSCRQHQQPELEPPSPAVRPPPAPRAAFPSSSCCALPRQGPPGRGAAMAAQASSREPSGGTTPRPPPGLHRTAR
ncbi:hypothetical protein P7K49_035362, partial [Saguinus oedipus]